MRNTDIKIGPNRDINKDHKKLPPDEPKKIVIPAAQNDVKMLTEKNNDEKLAITLLILGGGLIACHFKYNGIIIIHNRCCYGKCISI